MSGRVQCCLERSSRVPQILTRRSKATWDSRTASWAAEMVIFIYSNILLSVSMIITAMMRVGMRPRTAT